MRRLFTWTLGFLLLFAAFVSCLTAWAADPDLPPAGVVSSGELAQIAPVQPATPPVTLDDLIRVLRYIETLPVDPGAATSQPPPSDASQQVGDILANLAHRVPWIALLLSLMGLARFANKPFCAAVHWWVGRTKTTADDKFVARVERSQAWAWFWWFADYFASIKRDPPGTVVTVTKGSGTAALFLVGALGISAMSTGCTGLAPGAEAFVVRSEQTIASSFATVDTFVDWESANRASLPESVTAVADALRVDFPPAHDAALASLQVYKRTRSASDKDAVTTWLATLRAMADQATRVQSEISKP